MRGQAVTLYEQIQTGENAFHEPVYEETAVTVDNVLIGQPTTEDVISSTDLYGKKIVFMLGIPKGDTHDWTDKKISWVNAYGETITVKSFGFPITGVEELIPTPWHKKVRVEAYG